jgi:hypothetical protein
MGARGQGEVGADGHQDTPDHHRDSSRQQEGDPPGDQRLPLRSAARRLTTSTLPPVRESRPERLSTTELHRASPSSTAVPLTTPSHRLRWRLTPSLERIPRSTPPALLGRTPAIRLTPLAEGNCHGPHPPGPSGSDGRGSPSRGHRSVSSWLGWSLSVAGQRGRV